MDYTPELKFIQEKLVKIKMIGNRYGKLVVVGESGYKGGKRILNCLCDCGNSKDINMGSLRRGLTKSCGCIHIERIRKFGIENNRKHGLSATRFYRLYKGIIERCNNKKSTRYKLYGGIGITVSRLSFDEFTSDMYESYLDHVEKYGEKDTSIDRIDNNKGYSKDNCRRATIKEQQNNKLNNRIVEGKSIGEWSSILGIGYNKLYDRVVKLGRSIDKAKNTI